jgi:hypothetical protein
MQLNEMSLHGTEQTLAGSGRIAVSGRFLLIPDARQISVASNYGWIYCRVGRITITNQEMAETAYLMLWHEFFTRRYSLEAFADD